ncbi:hypothetical protein FMUND_12041 [Fusarium mundagurra]|uniref:Ankyrin repeat protein n=1 Tax=Fusarium mundagurra TaxID=1567541 RepID=A0A8H5Y5N3_9HYPO|nr:hypothetical protein FMUND_12041 [Fusarium mundagurra]
MSPQISGHPVTVSNSPPEIIQCIVDKILDENSLHRKQSWEWDYWSEPEPEHNPLQAYMDALNLAATCRDIRRLVTKQIYTRDVRENQSAALLVSAKCGEIAGVIWALEAGANIRSDDKTEAVAYYTAGPNAIKTGHRVPLNHDNQVTAIHWTAFNGHTDIVSLLLNHGANINHRVSIDVGLNALHQAVSNGDVGMAKYLLMEGIDPTSTDPFGKTPIHWIYCSREDMVYSAVKMIKTLVEHGAEINRWDFLGNTPLTTHLQNFEPNDSVIAELIRQGAHIYKGYYDGLEAPPNELSPEIYNAMEHVGFVGPGCEPVPLPPNHYNRLGWSKIREAIYHHFYKLIHQTDNVPEKLTEFSPAE